MTIRNIPSTNYSANTRTFTIPPNVTHRFAGIVATFTRENWPGTNPALLTVIFQRSTDGTNWLEIGRATFPGGTQIGPRGQPVTQNKIGFNFSQAQDGDIRVQLINTQTLRTAITLELVDA